MKAIDSLTSTASAVGKAAVDMTGAIGESAAQRIVSIVQRGPRRVAAKPAPDGAAATAISPSLSPSSLATPAAVVGLAGLGVAGIIEWPLVLAVGATAAIVNQLTKEREAIAALVVRAKAEKKASAPG